MLALMLWTLCVLLLLPLARYRAIRAGAVDWDDFAPGESARVPEPARRVNRALANLLEVPVIFYALVLACLMTARVDATALALAWAYVALRVAHTVVHLTYNPSRTASSCLPPAMGCWWLCCYAWRGASNETPPEPPSASSPSLFGRGTSPVAGASPATAPAHGLLRGLLALLGLSPEGDAPVPWIT